jgi:hypothetical protein
MLPVSPINIRPRIQMTILVVIFSVFGLIGVTYFTEADAIATQDWFALILGGILVPGSLVGIWRTLRLGIRIDDNGIRIRSQVDSRQQFIPWSQVESVECAEVGSRAGMTLYAPVLHLRKGAGVLPIDGLGSYSVKDAESKTARLRAAIDNQASHPGAGSCAGL